ncbi:MAG: methylenetetrahydrofolate--tRNA-(uracil(54)-C(5))-methyltransferase (FADH(2)-oxidizing) TrmFO [Syntrophomonadaceae bacterium]|jgi:methylenetetrahydrofolate--tRNA-(uracil-5-)-methyltransferase|nr:methylenetetrahydrofolate--tRNA-(uracil(54)-C(5))-methyltransferase (FADH(2)-oxidizing) TrmFO [Syntrophomonadaceae bacterium]
MIYDRVVVVGGGLAGCEAAFQLANMNVPVELVEMRPARRTAAHKTGYLGELVCSNSLKSEDINTAQGVLKREMRKLNSLILMAADRCRVPAGSALAVDRELLGKLVTEIITGHPLIQVTIKEMENIPEFGITVVASGPLTSDALSASIARLTGEEHLHFFDAVAPIIAVDSIDMNKVYAGSRYGKGEGDYLNCPLNQEEYEVFYEALLKADSVPLEGIDEGLYFSACVPIEVMARKGKDNLRFGPMRPVGLPHPESGQVPYAVVQLRQDNREGTMFSMVGFQTRMKWGEQERVLRLIPGLEKAEFLRLGVMHRNTYINSPRVLTDTLQFRGKPELFFAGQITGVEGYMESAATGIVAGINAARKYRGLEPVALPRETLIGALCRYISDPAHSNFQPMNANFGILPPLENRIKNKRLRNQHLGERSWQKIGEFSEEFVK